MICFIIPYRLPSLNDYISANRRNKYGGAGFKRQIEDGIIWLLKSEKWTVTAPISIQFTWYEQKRNRDKDNVSFAKKFILDALQKSGKLPNDNNQYILGFRDNFVYGEGDKVVIEIIEQ